MNTEKTIPALILGDKNAEFHSSLNNFLEDLDIEVKCFTTGERVISETKKNQNVFLIVLSESLSDIDSFSTIDIIQQKSGHNIPIVVLLQKYSDDLQKKIIQRNILCSIGEPINLQDLKTLVKKNLQNHLSKKD
ncbi:MAG: hypothetical protein HQK83_04425 [Fibrobacteria bacterium]|nr:hypothetical protein [Fibrobacteria bacterium]